MHYVLYRNTQAYGANITAGFLKYFTPQVSEGRPVLAPMLSTDPLSVDVRAFANMDAAIGFLESLSAAVMTPRSDGNEDPFFGWTPLGVPDGDDRRARIKSEGLEEV